MHSSWTMYNVHSKSYASSDLASQFVMPLKTKYYIEEYQPQSRIVARGNPNIEQRNIIHSVGQQLEETQIFNRGIHRVVGQQLEETQILNRGVHRVVGQQLEETQILNRGVHRVVGQWLEETQILNKGNALHGVYYIYIYYSMDKSSYNYVICMY